jgi:DNA topoisomerase IB
LRAAGLIETVAQRRGNTRSVCRRCYGHPAIVDAAVLTLLQQHLKQETRRRRRAA